MPPITVLTTFTSSVVEVLPVTTPFRIPVAAAVVPTPTVTPVSACVTPNPTLVAAIVPVSSVGVMVWSAALSMIATLMFSDQLPGFLAAKYQFVSSA